MSQDNESEWSEMNQNIESEWSDMSQDNESEWSDTSQDNESEWSDMSQNNESVEWHINLWSVKKSDSSVLIKVVQKKFIIISSKNN